MSTEGRKLWISAVSSFISDTSAIERLYEEFKRRIKTESVLSSAEAACMLFWALLASAQFTLRRVDGWDAANV